MNESDFECIAEVKWNLRLKFVSFFVLQDNWEDFD